MKCCSAGFEFGIETFDVVNVDIDVRLDGLSFSFREFAAPNLEMNGGPGTMNDAVNPTSLFTDTGEESALRVELKTQDVSVVLCRLSNVTYT